MRFDAPVDFNPVIALRLDGGCEDRAPGLAVVLPGLLQHALHHGVGLGHGFLDLVDGLLSSVTQPSADGIGRDLGERDAPLLNCADQIPVQQHGHQVLDALHGEVAGGKNFAGDGARVPHHVGLTCLKAQGLHLIDRIAGRPDAFVRQFDELGQRVLAHVVRQIASDGLGRGAFEVAVELGQPFVCRRGPLLVGVLGDDSGKSPLGFLGAGAGRSRWRDDVLVVQ